MTRSYCQLAPEMDESNFQTLKLLWDRACKLCRDQINGADYLHQYPTIFQDYIQHPNTTSMINKEKFLSIHNTNTSIWLKMAIFGPNYNIAINIVKLCTDGPIGKKQPGHVTSAVNGGPMRTGPQKQPKIQKNVSHI